MSRLDHTTGKEVGRTIWGTGELQCGVYRDTGGYCGGGRYGLETLRFRAFEDLGFWGFQVPRFLGSSPLGLEVFDFQVSRLGGLEGLKLLGLQDRRSSGSDYARFGKCESLRF